MTASSPFQVDSMGGSKETSEASPPKVKGSEPPKRRPRVSALIQVFKGDGLDTSIFLIGRSDHFAADAYAGLQSNSLEGTYSPEVTGGYWRIDLICDEPEPLVLPVPCELLEAHVPLELPVPADVEPKCYDTRPPTTKDDEDSLSLPLELTKPPSQWPAVKEQTAEPSPQLTQLRPRMNRMITAVAKPLPVPLELPVPPSPVPDTVPGSGAASGPEGAAEPSAPFAGVGVVPGSGATPLHCISGSRYSPPLILYCAFYLYSSRDLICVFSF